MKSKKVIAAALAGACIMIGAAFGGCSVKGNENSDGNSENVNSENVNSEIYAVYQTYAAHASAQGDAVLSYEQWLQSIKGEDGKDGAKGDKGEDGKYIVSAKQVFADRWQIAYYFEFTFSDDSKITTESTAVVTIDPDKIYVAQTEEECTALRGYGVAEEKINYAPVYDPAEYAFAAPLKNIETVITNHGDFGEYALGAFTSHKGLDFTASAGEEIFAGFDGVVTKITADGRDKYNSFRYGTQIVIEHAYGLQSIYDCIDAKEGLKVGDRVNKGDVIGTVTSVQYDIDQNATNSGTVGSVVKDEKGQTAIEVYYEVTMVYTDEEGVEQTVKQTLYDNYTLKNPSKEFNVGDSVSKGELLGTNTVSHNGSEWKLGDHLHFEIIINGVSEDPKPYLGIE